jgi:predicted nucleotidyltransferase
MSQLLTNLVKKKLITPPKWLPSNTMYLCLMGSKAYGVQEDDSDDDLYGFCIPPKNFIFKPMNQYIHGFDTPDSFDQWQQHGIIDASARKEYDFSVYNITKYFRLVMDNNPNCIDSLFVSRNCVIHSTPISEKIRDNRNMFLHKGAWARFKGYSYSQLHKMNIKQHDPESKRGQDQLKYGYSTKFAYHIVRLLNEVEQILTEGTLDLQRNNDQLKSIRRGEWTKEAILEYFKDKENDLEKVYSNSQLPYGPDVDRIRALLFECIEMHYDLSETIVIDTKAESKLLRIQDIINE